MLGRLLDTLYVVSDVYRGLGPLGFSVKNAKQQGSGFQGYKGAGLKVQSSAPALSTKDLNKLTP